jgi:integrase
MITLSPVVVEMLKAHHQHLLEEKVRIRQIWQELGLMFLRPDGVVLGISGITLPLKGICRRAGVDVCFHFLRHTHAPDLIAANIHAKFIPDEVRAERHFHHAECLRSFVSVCPGCRHQR